MQTIALVLHFLSRHESVVAAICIGLALLLFSRAGTVDGEARRSEGAKRDGSLHRAAAGLLFVFAFANLAIAELWVNPLVLGWGEAGRGTVLRIEPTRVHVNYRPVNESIVLLKTAAGETVESSFRSNDDCVVPVPSGEYALPSPGIAFGTKYLPSYPSVFVIVSDDDSPYARELRCAGLVKELTAARARHELDPSDAAARTESDRLSAAVARCGH